MQYFGGKKRIAKPITEYLNSKIDTKKYYFEPFVGSASILERINGKRFASDKNEYLIEMYIAIQQGWLPPQEVSQEEYYRIKENKDQDKALTGFVGIACSYSGKWFDGYARNTRGYNYAISGYNSLMAQRERILTAEFKWMDYREAHPKNSLVYCDPPYYQTRGYNGMGKFDSDSFWQTMREWSRRDKNNLVFISEYTAPDDFECVLEIESRLNIRNKEEKLEKRIERLFTYKN